MKTELTLNIDEILARAKKASVRRKVSRRKHGQ